jgi:hypothetical protein
MICGRITGQEASDVNAGEDEKHLQEANEVYH